MKEQLRLVKISVFSEWIHIFFDAAGIEGEMGQNGSKFNGKRNIERGDSVDLGGGDPTEF